MKNILKLCIIATPLLCSSIHAMKNSSQQRCAEFDRRMKQQNALAIKQASDDNIMHGYIRRGQPIPETVINNRNFHTARAHNKKLAEQKQKK